MHARSLPIARRRRGTPDANLSIPRWPRGPCCRPSTCRPQHCAAHPRPRCVGGAAPPSSVTEKLFGLFAGTPHSFAAGRSARGERHDLLVLGAQLVTHALRETKRRKKRGERSSHCQDRESSGNLKTGPGIKYGGCQLEVVGRTWNPGTDPASPFSITRARTNEQN